MHAGLLLENIQADAGHASGLHGADEGVLIDDGTAAGVDDEHALAHLGKLGIGEQMPRLGRQRAVDADGVGLP